MIPLANINQEELLRLAAVLESRSEHHIAAGIVEEAGARGLALGAPQDFQAIPGRGAQATVDGGSVKVVSPGYLREHGLRADDERVQAAAG